MLPEEEQSYLNYSGSIKSKFTLQTYDFALRKFKGFCGVNSYTQLLELGDIKQTQQVIQNFIMSEKKRVRAQTLSVYLTALWHFYQYNDVIGFNWVKLRAFIGEVQKSIKDRAYTVEECRKALDHSDLKKKVLLLLMVSTGMRMGAIPPLKLRNLEQLDGLYRITVYENTQHEYSTYCTPECERAIKDYLEYRKRAGEEITQEAPLIREQIAIPNKPRHIGVDNLNSLVRELLEQAGVREHRTGDRMRKHPVMLNHGFRKFYNTQMIKAGVKTVVKEILIGHKAIGLESSYYRPTDDELLMEYLKAVDFLTISTEKKLRMENADLSKKLVGEEKLLKRMLEMDKKLQSIMKGA